MTARTLDELGRTALVIEEGASVASNEATAFTTDDMERKYRNGGITAAFGRPNVIYVEGSVVGGGSEVNAGLYHRTPRAILDEWRRDYRCEGLDSPTLDPLFEYCENALNVTLDQVSPTASLKLAEGASALGWASKQVPRWIRWDRRQSMSTAILPTLSSAIEVRSSIRARRVYRSANHWHVETDQGCIAAQRVYLCAGAIATPSLLLRSGICHNVGRSLQMHPSFKFVAEFDDVINSSRMGVPFHQVTEFHPEMSFGCSISSPSYLAVGLIDQPDEITTLNRRWQNMAIYYGMIRPRSRGLIRNVPFQAEPIVSLSLNSLDLAAVAKSVERLAKILFAAGARRLFPGLAGATTIRSADEARGIDATVIRNRARLMTVHVFASCPMGEDRSKSATDSFGRVWDQKDLFINDASLLCTAPGVNPQGTVMTLARRNVLNHAGRL